jgi:hypothetical protein
MSPEEGPRTRQPLPEGASVGYPPRRGAMNRQSGDGLMAANFQCRNFDAQP